MLLAYGIVWGIGRRHNHKVGFNPGLCEHLAHFVFDVFNISLGHNGADDADGVIAPLAVPLKHEGQRQHLGHFWRNSTSG